MALKKLFPLHLRLIVGSIPPLLKDGVDSLRTDFIPELELFGLPLVLHIMNNK